MGSAGWAANRHKTVWLVAFIGVKNVGKICLAD